MKVNKHIQLIDYPEYANASLTVNKAHCNLSQHTGRKKIFDYAFSQDKKLISLIASLEHLREEHILLTAGADAALHHVAETFLDLGKISIIPVPSFGRFEFHTKVLGAKAIFVKHTKFPYSFDLKRITRMAKAKNASIIFLANPNNPTGELISTKRLKSFIEENKNSLVVIDEVLIENSEDSVSGFTNLYKNLIVIKSFSKLLEIPGLRIGYMLADKSLIKVISKTVSPYELSSISLDVTKRALSDGRYQINIKKKQDARNFLKKQLPLLLTNTHASVGLIYGKKNISLFDYLLKHGILTVNGKMFRGLERTNTIRITINNKKDMKKLISVIKKYKRENT